MSNIHVHKFGGASVKDAQSIQNVYSILKKASDKKSLIVVSAMGKTTNKLEQITRAYFYGDASSKKLLNELRKEHFDIAIQLFGQQHPIFDTINDLFVEIEWIIEEDPVDGYNYYYDQIVSIGELVSTQIIANYISAKNLNCKWIDARDYIKTNEDYRNAKIDWKATMEAIKTIVKLFKDTNFIITQGYIGQTDDLNTTTLGREGSDFSASIFANCLDTNAITIWKDVPGIMTADPKEFPKAQLIPKLDYNEAIQMTYYGSKVLHPKSIIPLKQKKTPLFIQCFSNPGSIGTEINYFPTIKYPPIVSVLADQAYIKFSLKDGSFISENHLSFLFNKISENRLPINIMRNSAFGFYICTNDIQHSITSIKKEIETDYNMKIVSNLSLFTIRHGSTSDVENLSRDKTVLLEESHEETDILLVVNTK